MNAEQCTLLLKLFFTDGVAAALLRRALEAGGDAASNPQRLLALCADTEQRQRVAACLADTDGDRALKRSAAIDATQHWLASPDHHLVWATDDNYPPLLRQIADYPPLLFVKGDVSCLRRPMLAIVGSRSSTAYGRSVAYRLAGDLADMGLLVCSGLAGGIDTQAHRAALDAGKGTVAVLGNGLGSVYPAVNKALAEHIVNQRSGPGALIAELPLDAGPVAGHFPRRNRIISGMSLGVCVVEANMRSGSLITARLALEQNREVFAVPGSINSPVSRGCHQLLRQGAVLAETAQDIAEHIRFSCQAQMAMAYADFAGVNADAVAKPSSGNAVEAIPDGCDTVYQQLCQDATSVDTLSVTTGLGLAELSEKLLRLELAGAVERQGNRWRRS